MPEQGRPFTDEMMYLIKTRNQNIASKCLAKGCGFVHAFFSTVGSQLNSVKTKEINRITDATSAKTVCKVPLDTSLRLCYITTNVEEFVTYTVWTSPKEITHI